jgi:hypothetical protein
MHRIDTVTKSANLFGTGKDGFKAAVPGLISPTALTDDFMNALQEEIAHTVEDSAGYLTKTDNTQLLNAALNIISKQAFLSIYQEIDGGASNLALYKVAANNLGTIVAVGQANGVASPYIIQSTNGGFSYTTRTTTAAQNKFLRGVCYGGGQFVAVGETDAVDGLIVTSADGVTWTEQLNPSAYTLNGVAYNDVNLYVAVGEVTGASPYIVKSADGINWTAVTSAKNVALKSVAVAKLAGSSYWRAVGDVDGATGGPYIIASINGATWTQGTVSVPKAFCLRDVCHNQKPLSYGSRWVAVGDADGVDGYILTATGTGTTWTECTNAKNVDLKTVSYNNGVWVAAGGYSGSEPSYVLVSIDGTTWTQIYINDVSMYLYGIVNTLGKWTFVGQADGANAYVLQSKLASPRY